MELKANDYTMKLTHQELYCIGMDTKHAILHAVEKHWVNNQTDWLKAEKQRLDRCKKIFECLGRLDIYQETFDEIQELFDEFNDGLKNNSND